MIILTNNTGIATPVFEEMARMYGSHPRMGNDHFSATEMNKSIKDIIFSRRSDKEVVCDIQYRMKAIRGTWFHEAMEHRLMQRDDCICENRFSMEVEVETDFGSRIIKLSGGIDCLWKDEEGNYWILDYKNSTQAKIDKQSNGEDLEWKRQMYIYARLVEVNMGIRPIGAIMVCFDDSKRSGDIDIAVPTSCIAQQFSIDLSDREYEKALFEDIARRLRVISECLELGYKVPDCSIEEMWCTETRFGVKKSDAESMWRTYPTLEDAVKAIADMKAKDKTIYHIYELPGRPKKCERFCDYCGECEQGKAMLKRYFESLEHAKEFDNLGNEIIKEA